ncbi:DNA methyltransferase [Sinorhizobium meliloti]|uniref:DNA methyltransferase n=1 Tax=Rhizobium meliloti TaxID=382 RepID=UPI003D64B2FB
MSVNAVDQVITDRYAIYQGDACELIRAVPGDSVHFGIHSPPFEGLYKFSNYDRDISNNDGPAFWEHYAFLISELFRVTRPGRIHSVHCMQLPTSKTRHGFIGMRDFRGELIRAYCGEDAEAMNEAIMALCARRVRMELAGDTDGFHRLDDLIGKLKTERDDKAYATGQWIFHSEVCIWKDPVIAQQRTKSIRLLHKQITKDSTISGMGLADYIVSFRKPGENADPVAGMFERWSGDESLDISREAYERHRKQTEAEGRKAWPFEQWRSILVWQRYASPVWTDINQTNTLQYRAGRDEKDEQHISPLQLDVIERCLDLWSAPGETVLTPFLGIGSEVYSAVKLGRKGIGFELKPSYFRQAVKNIAELDNAATDSLFSMVGAA